MQGIGRETPPTPPPLARPLLLRAAQRRRLRGKPRQTAPMAVPVAVLSWPLVGQRSCVRLQRQCASRERGPGARTATLLASPPARVLAPLHQFSAARSISRHLAPSRRNCNSLPFVAARDDERRRPPARQGEDPQRAPSAMALLRQICEARRCLTSAGGPSPGPRRVHVGLLRAACVCVCTCGWARLCNSCQSSAVARKSGGGDV